MAVSPSRSCPEATSAAYSNYSLSRVIRIGSKKYTPLPGDMGSVSPFDAAFHRTSRHFAYSLVSRLRQLVSSPSFKVIEVAREIQNGQEFIRVDHDFERHEAVGDSHTRIHGSLWLDPSQCWCIRRCKRSHESTIRGQRSSHTESEVVCETINHPSGFPILKSSIQHVKTFNYKNKQTIEWTTKTDYELEVNDSVPDSEFTLSAFGLPEPGSEPVKKSIPLFVWVLVAAGICAALSLSFRYLARRRTRAQPTA